MESRHNTDQDTVVGVFPGYTEARLAVESLRQEGVPEDRIGILGPWQEVTEDTQLPDHASKTMWEEGAGLGAAAGALLGTGMGLAVAAGLMTPVGPVIAGGTALALLASAGAGAAVGTVIGALAGLGVPEDDASFYEAELHAGKVLVVVRPGETRGEAPREVIRRHGGLVEPAGSVPYGTGLEATPY